MLPDLNTVRSSARIKDPKSYAGGSVATGRVSHAGQAKGVIAKHVGLSWPSNLMDGRKFAGLSRKITTITAPKQDVERIYGILPSTHSLQLT
jgi:hypothetical protein